ncbi:hypothetical protein WJM93_15510 [Lactiplantibacillus plantarum]|uniref:hypothetical protein n=1 Tax=Lactiplantibacillus plantarum TaxID=1590 RepID=UPI0030AB1A15
MKFNIDASKIGVSKPVTVVTTNGNLLKLYKLRANTAKNELELSRLQKTLLKLSETSESDDDDEKIQVKFTESWARIQEVQADNIQMQLDFIAEVVHLTATQKKALVNLDLEVANDFFSMLADKLQYGELPEDDMPSKSTASKEKSE